MSPYLLSVYQNCFRVKALKQSYQQSLQYFLPTGNKTHTPYPNTCCNTTRLLGAIIVLRWPDQKSRTRVIR